MAADRLERALERHYERFGTYPDVQTINLTDKQRDRLADVLNAAKRNEPEKVLMKRARLSAIPADRHV